MARNSRGRLTDFSKRRRTRSENNLHPHIAQLRRRMEEKFFVQKKLCQAKSGRFSIIVSIIKRHLPHTRSVRCRTILLRTSSATRACGFIDKCRSFHSRHRRLRHGYTIDEHESPSPGVMDGVAHQQHTHTVISFYQQAPQAAFFSATTSFQFLNNELEAIQRFPPSMLASLRLWF